MDYIYDVAFSLTEDSKEIGRQINNLLKNKLKTFIYFENTPEIAAQNGLERFYNIFYNESRIVVILYSTKWGNTKWTMKEQKAIQQRILDTSWDFIIMVKLDKLSTTPEWYPNPYIYVDYEAVGPEGVANIIEYKVRESGGKIKNESFEERAKRISAEREILFKIKQTLQKENVGIKMATEEVKLLFDIFKEKINNISGNNHLFAKITKEEQNFLQIEINRFILNIQWNPESINLLGDSHLDFNLKKPIKGKDIFSYSYVDAKLTSYLFDINPSWMNGWKEKKQNAKFSTSSQLVESWLNILLNYFDPNLQKSV